MREPEEAVPPGEGYPELAQRVAVDRSTSRRGSALQSASSWKADKRIGPPCHSSGECAAAEVLVCHWARAEKGVRMSSSDSRPAREQIYESLRKLVPRISRYHGLPRALEDDLVHDAWLAVLDEATAELPSIADVERIAKRVVWRAAKRVQRSGRRASRPPPTETVRNTGSMSKTSELGTGPPRTARVSSPAASGGSNRGPHARRLA